MSESGASVYYFAYGSNADPERFKDRVGAWRTRRRGWLPDHRLRFADSVQSEGGGGAVIDPHPGGRVDGVVFEITGEQLAAMDREEFDPSRDTSRLGRRLTVQVLTEDGSLEAEVYTVVDEGGRRAPSERYLRHILDGLADAGHPTDVLKRVRQVAAES